MTKNSRSSQDEVDDSVFLHINEQWALLPPDPANNLSVENNGKPTLTFFMPWIAEDNMPNAMLNCCHSLSANPPDWPGIRLGFVEKPSPGFVIRIAKGWEPANATQERSLFQKVLWEIQRMERS